MVNSRPGAHAAGAQRLSQPPPEPPSGALSEPDNVRPASLREVMSQFATGVTVLTAGGLHCHGMTANAFTSVSLDPPLVLCCVSRTARMHDAITSAGCFGVSVLGGDQEGLARYFADQERPTGAAQFDTVEWLPGPVTGAPLLGGALAWLECGLVHTYDGGDHSIFLGDVLGSTRSAGGQALVFYARGFHRVPLPTAR